MGLKLLQRELFNNKLTAEDKLLMMRDIQSSLNIAIDILNDLLNYEKLDAGIMKLDLESLSVWSLIHESITPFYLQVSS